MKLTPHTLIKDNKNIPYSPPFKSFAEFLEKNAQKYTTKPAIIFDDFVQETTIEINYQKLEKLTANIAHSLRENFQLQSQEAVSFCFPNTPEVILLNYSAWRMGALTVPLDSTRDTVDKKIYKLEQTAAKLYFTRKDAKSLAENTKIQAALPHLQIIETTNLEDLKKKLKLEKIQSTQSTQFPHKASLNDPCLILYTSGTTAMPKGVQLTLKNLFANAHSIKTWLNFDETDRWNVILPLHHINSTTFVNTTLLAGGTIILSPAYSKSRFWEILAKNKATGTSIVPTIAYDLVSEQDSFRQHQKNLSQVTRFQLGSAPVQPKTVEKLIDLYHIPLYQGYGQTETSLRSTGTPTDLTEDQYKHIREINSLGTELEFTNVAILNAQGDEAQPEEVGDICIRGPIIMSGYLQNPTATEESFVHGWFHSGDTGYYKEIYDRKFFFLKGRTKEIIKKGGVLISPLAVENALLAHYPDLEKIYVVGFPDLRLGEEIGFVAIAQDSNIAKKILEEGAAGKIPGLSAYEVPRAGMMVEDSQLPTTATGKIQRLKIKEIFGPELLKKYRTVASNAHFTFRQLGPEETAALQEALEINNDRWGENLATDLTDFTNRAENAILIGIFDKKNPKFPLGTITALKIIRDELTHVTQKNHWTATWEGITGHHTYTTHDHKGDALVLVAVSVKSTHSTSTPKSTPAPHSTSKLTAAQLKQYFQSNQDPVLSFHYQAKAGLKTGAKFVTAIPNARPADTDSLGYCVLVKYPELNKKLVINEKKSPGVQLVEAALLYTQSCGIKEVFAYSRPAGLRKFLAK